jgi:hypothetical protein
MSDEPKTSYVLGFRGGEQKKLMLAEKTCGYDVYGEVAWVLVRFVEDHSDD